MAKKIQPTYMIVLSFGAKGTYLHYILECDPKTMTLRLCSDGSNQYLLEDIDPIGKWKLAASEVCGAIQNHNPNLDMSEETLWVAKLIKAMFEAAA